VVTLDETLRHADHFLCFALSRSRFAPVCGAREAQARQRAALIKVGCADFFLMPQPPLLFQEGSCPQFARRLNHEN
jgi:hypothetical protein